MAKNGKEAIKKSENGYTNKINGSLCLVMGKEMKMTKGIQKRKELPKMARTRAKNVHQNVVGS